MAATLIQRSLRRGRVANRLGVALLLALSAVLIFSLLAGVKSLGTV